MSSILSDTHVFLNELIILLNNILKCSTRTDLMFFKIMFGNNLFKHGISPSPFFRVSESHV